MASKRLFATKSDIKFSWNSNNVAVYNAHALMPCMLDILPDQWRVACASPEVLAMMTSVLRRWRLVYQVWYEQSWRCQSPRHKLSQFRLLSTWRAHFATAALRASCWTDTTFRQLMVTPRAQRLSPLTANRL